MIKKYVALSARITEFYDLEKKLILIKQSISDNAVFLFSVSIFHGRVITPRHDDIKMKDMT